MSIDLHENDFDAFMKHKFEGHTSSPLPEYWDQIESQLNHQNVVQGKRTIRYWLGAVAAAAIILAISLYYTVKENPANPLKYSDTIHSSVQHKKDFDQFVPENTVYNTRKNARNTQNSKPENKNNLLSSEPDQEVRSKKTDPFTIETNPVSTNIISKETTIALKNPELLHESLIKNAFNDTVLKEQTISPFTNTVITGKTAVNENVLFNVTDSIQPFNPFTDTIIASLAGNTKPAPTPKHRMSYEVFFTPGYSYRTLSDNRAYYNPEYNKAYFDKHDKGYITFSSGLLTNYKINGKISISSGLSYAQYSQEFSTESFHVNYDGAQDAWIYTSSGDLHFKITASDSISQNDILRSSVRFSYINIPLLFEYKFAKHYFIDAGISYSYLISQTLNLKAENYDGNCETTPISGLKKNSFCFNLGIGREIPLNNNFSLIIQPSINLFITSINDKASVKSYPFSIGLQTGLRYSL